MRGLISTAVLIVIVGFAAFLVHNNSERVSINLVFTVFAGVPLWGALLGTLMLGALSAGLACLWPLLRLRLQVRRQSRQITRLEQEIHGLRTLPLEEEAHAAETSAQEG
jgi:uncharacterized integral membrane protein